MAASRLRATPLQLATVLNRNQLRSKGDDDDDGGGGGSGSGGRGVAMVLYNDVVSPHI